jgi:hypothetical protein
LSVACGADPNPYRPFPGISTITRLEPRASSVYHALQASARRNFKGLTLNASYTYSHSIDDSSDRYDTGFVNSYNPASSRASSNFDARHLFNLGYVYDLPFFRKPGFAHSVLGGWEWSGIVSLSSGTPFTVTNSAAFPDNAGVGNGVGTQSYPDVLGSAKSGIPPASAGSSSYSGFFLNPGAFAAPRGLTFGDAGRNSMTNPHRYNFDMALYKRFAITERYSFEFRAEAFNVFNHPQWNPIAGNAGSAGSNGSSSGTNAMSCYAGPRNSAGDPSCLASANFLQIGSAHSARILQLGAKFIF